MVFKALLDIRQYDIINKQIRLLKREIDLSMNAGLKMANVSRETKSEDKGHKRLLRRRNYYGRAAWNFI